MDGMSTTPAHAKPARRDLLWALVAILACGLLEVWASWLQIGAVSGFPKLGAMTTGWILPVTTEFYWIAALQAWLVDPAGPRSRTFAMWSAAGVFALSLAGQESDHLLAAAGDTAPPAAVVGFVTALPLIAVALIAILIHLRQKDREDAAEVVRQDARERERVAAEVAATDERAMLRAALDALTGELEAAQADRETAQRELAEALTRAEKLAAKLAALSAKKDDPKPRKGAGGTAHAGDLTTEFRAFELLRDNPELRAPRMGAELGRKLGASEATGRRLHGRLIVNGELVQPLTEPLTERSPDQSGERFRERS